jgi:hypothetical protein
MVMSEKETRAEEAPDLWTQLEDILGMVGLAGRRDGMPREATVARPGLGRPMFAMQGRARPRQEG